MSALIFRIWFQANLLFPLLLLVITGDFSWRNFQWTELPCLFVIYPALLLFTILPVLLLVFISDLIESVSFSPPDKFIWLMVAFSLVVMPLFFLTLSFFTGDFLFWFVSEYGLSITVPAILSGLIPSLLAYKKFIQQFSLAGNQAANSIETQSTYK